MNLLTEDLPEAIEVAGKNFPINWDFRTGLRIMEAWEDPELTGYEKQLIMISLLYKETPPEIAKACELAMLFLNCGASEGEGEDPGLPADRLFSFGHDARFIYTAFQQSHGVDLTRENLHWWKFCALFMDLKDCLFVRLINLRRQLKAGQATKEERQWYGQIKKIVDLPESYSAEELAAIQEFEELLNG